MGTPPPPPGALGKARLQAQNARGGGKALGGGRFSISTAVAAAGPHIRSDARHSRHMALRVNTP